MSDFHKYDNASLDVKASVIAREINTPPKEGVRGNAVSLLLSSKPADLAKLTEKVTNSVNMSALGLDGFHLSQNLPIADVYEGDKDDPKVVAHQEMAFNFVSADGKQHVLLTREGVEYKPSVADPLWAKDYVPSILIGRPGAIHPRNQAVSEAPESAQLEHQAASKQKVGDVGDNHHRAPTATTAKADSPDDRGSEIAGEITTPNRMNWKQREQAPNELEFGSSNEAPPAAKSVKALPHAAGRAPAGAEMADPLNAEALKVASEINSPKWTERERARFDLGHHQAFKKDDVAELADKVTQSVNLPALGLEGFHLDKNAPTRDAEIALDHSKVANYHEDGFNFVSADGKQHVILTTSGDQYNATSDDDNVPMTIRRDHQADHQAVPPSSENKPDNYPVAPKLGDIDHRVPTSRPDKADSFDKRGSKTGSEINLPNHDGPTRAGAEISEPDRAKVLRLIAHNVMEASLSDPVKSGEGFYQMLKRMHPELPPEDASKQARHLRHERESNGQNVNLKVGERVSLISDEEKQSRIQAALDKFYSSSAADQAAAIAAARAAFPDTQPGPLSDASGPPAAASVLGMEQQHANREPLMESFSNSRAHWASESTGSPKVSPDEEAALERERRRQMQVEDQSFIS